MKKLQAVALLAVAAAFTGTAAELPFIRDNEDRALAEAKERKLPVFVEVSAPW